jgi:hypothetical protein
MGYIKNFFLELKAWRIVHKEYRKNKADFLNVGLKASWFGKLYRVINRDTEIELGSGEDEVYLRKELAEVWAMLVKHNLADILAYELKPLDSETQIDETHVEYEHGYLITLTPAWSLDRQYVTPKSVILMTLFGGGLIGGIIYGVINYLIPFIQSL